MNMNHNRKRPASVLAWLGISGLFISSLAGAGDIVVIMAPGASPLSKEDVSKVYVGRSKDLKPIDLPEASPLREAFYKKATGRDLSQIKAVWSRLAFTSDGTPPKSVADDAAVKKAVASDPKAIGYIAKADVDGTVKVVLELD
jgi:hypothetical protein